MMAAGSLCDDFSISNHKRKRMNDDDHFTTGNELFIAKRRNLTQLPIRSPPRPSIALTSPFGSYGIPPGTLTPDSIPEVNEDEITQRDEAQPDDTPPSQMDTDMDTTPPKPNISTPIRIGRARSNDLMSPVRSPTTLQNLSPMPSRTFAHDRIPTPVASSFSACSPFEASFSSAAARQMRPHLLSTSLSPMVDAESWTPQIQRPPSPDTDIDEDTIMEVEDSNTMSSSFSGLSVQPRGMHDYTTDLPSSPTSQWSPRSPTSPRARGLGLAGTSHVRPDGLRMSTISDSERGTGAHTRNQSSGRTARLHMGFRADCEKCVARVPGHYSHIFWT